MRGLGLDAVSLARLEALVARHGERFVARCYREGESGPWRRDGGCARLAECWAAKEAFVKAIGPGAASVPYRDVEVVYADDAPPALRLHGRAAELRAAHGGGPVRLTLARDGDLASALVVLD